MTSSVVLHVYDLSMGMASQMSQSLVGEQIDGVWHTGVVVFGNEYFYGGGIQKMPPQQVKAMFGLSPVQTLTLGTTSKSVDDLHSFLSSLANKYHQGTYDLFHNNCNHFSDEVAKFLLQTGIPAHIVELPNKVLGTPIGQMLANMYSQMQHQMHDKMIPLQGESAFAPSELPSATTPSTTAADASAPPAEETQGPQMKLTVQVTEERDHSRLEISVPVDGSVVDLKTQLHKKTGYQPSDQRVIFQGKVLNNDAKLDTFGISDGKALHLVPKSGATKVPFSSSGAAPVSQPAPVSQTNAPVTAATATATPGATVVSREAALTKIKANPKDVQASVFKTILKIIDHIINNPNEPKYRKLKKENAAFKKRVASVPGALEFVLSMGFKESTETVEGVETVYFVLDANAEAWNVLVNSQAMLKEGLAQATAVNAPTGAPGGFPTPPTVNPGAPMGMPAGMPDPALMTQMLQNPAMMQQMMQNPMVQQLAGGNPMLQQQLQMLTQNPAMLQQMMQNPQVQQMMQNPQMMQQIMSGAMGGGANPMAGFGGATPTPSNNGNSSGTNTANNNSSGGSAQQTEDEMLQEAIRRSLEEQ